ncbi:MAG: dTMP kinase [Anaerolineae bacterium]|jgi:dTMP kinase|nr:dTMP kinase [Anaerolineae bacterium]
MFITFEGMDGSGKTTQVERLAATLRARGHEVIITREPGGTQIGEQVRAILMDKANTSLNARAELLLFCASRAQLVADVIRPHLAAGGVVICDRYIDSSLAYQGYGQEIGADVLWPILDFATGGLLPDLTLYLDIAPDEGLRRRAQASLFGEEFTRIDAMASAFHHRVYHGYAELAKWASDRWLTVDASRTPDTVQADILRAVESRLRIPR